MANSFDSRIKQLNAADSGTAFTADTVPLDAAFDVRADVEAGDGIHGFTVDQTLSVSVINVSKSRQIAQKTITTALPPVQNTEFHDVLVASIAPGWGTSAADAEIGDVLEAVASYVVNAGVYTDYSEASTQRFIVTK